MSGISGIFNLDGRPVDRELLGRMTDVIAYRGPDRGGVWSDGPVGLGHRMLCTTPESLRETQPLRDERADLCLVMDGRVDNRDELRGALLARGARPRDDTDAELVLRAYEVWGEECPKHIVGDFAFAIWDGRRRQLFCARDAIGVRPFFYHLNGQTFMFGTEVRQFFEDPTVKRRPNEGMIAEYLADEFTSLEETLYQGIFRLQPAHSLVFSQEGGRKQRYWDIDPAIEILHRSDTEYAEHFLEVFGEAVKSRLRSCGPVGAELSGGLDSSSVTSVMCSLYSEQAVSNTSFETFSLVFPGTHGDERAYIRDAVQPMGLRSNFVYPELSELSNEFAEEVRTFQDFPSYPNGIMHRPLYALASAKGVRTLLGGHGGDQWFTGSLQHYADFVRNFEILPFVRQAFSDQYDTYYAGVPSLFASSTRAFKIGILPFVPAFVRKAGKRVLQSWFGHKSPYPWISESFINRTSLFERINNTTSDQHFSSLAQKHIYSPLTTGWMAYGIEVMSRSSESFKIENRHPFLDRRVVKFALALPEEQRWRRNQQKIIVRNAMKKHLPKSIYQRQTKGDFSHVFGEMFLNLGGPKLFESLSIVHMGWIDGNAIRKMYEDLEFFYRQGDIRFSLNMWQLWSVLGIELWFNAVFLNIFTNN